MPKIKDIPKVDRPREKFLKKGPDALSKSDLLAILLGSGIKGKNVQKLSQQIIKKFGKDFLNITVSDLLKISGIGQAKALQIASAISLVKRFYKEKKGNEIIIKNPKDVFSLIYDLKDKKKEYLVCLYLNARNILIKKETISVGLLDKSLLHPREIFQPAIELNAASVILVHNHPSGNPTPTEKDIKIIERIARAGELMGIFIIDFLIVAKDGNYSFYKNLKNKNKNFDYVADGIQEGLFDLLIEKKEEYNQSSDEKNKEIRFIDLFAGIGGFHLAMNQLQNEKGIKSKCVFVSEIDKEAASVYKYNFSCDIFGDITKIDEKIIPNFDFLCAGFPCQPFSKGGHRKGFDDTRGTLFFNIIKILEYHKPKYFLLENVSNLATHDDGNTYNVIIRKLQNLGYSIPASPLILSPDNFGIPTLRKRVYIYGILKDISGSEYLSLNFSSEFLKKNKKDIYSIVSKNKVALNYYISEYEKKILKMWNDFYQGIDIKIIGFPIWAEEFTKNYNYSELPKWKQNFIKKNRELYIRNKSFINKWLKKYKYLEWCKATHRKLEWQAGDKYNSIYECLIQFRPSGVRVKRPDIFSTLVAMNHPQIIGKYLRRLTVDETKQLQSFPDSFKLHQNNNLALRHLGNAVNVEVVKNVITKLLNL